MTLAHAQGMPLGKDSLSDNKISVTVKTNAMALGMLIANAGVELGFGDRFFLAYPLLLLWYQLLFRHIRSFVSWVRNQSFVTGPPY